MTAAPSTRVRLPPTAPTLRELFLYSGNHCAFHMPHEACATPLLREDQTWDCQIAHIHGVKEDAARGKHNLSNEELREPENLILMCSKHHTVIDNKKLDAIYTVEVVQQMKARHEAPYRTAIFGLERMFDITAGVIPTYPVNLSAIEGIDDEVRDISIKDMRQFIDALAKQPPAMRDLLALILIHGSLERRFGSGFTPGVGAPVTQIEGVASVSPEEVHRRARHLKDAGYLSIFDDDGFHFLALTDPRMQETGWDIFADLKHVVRGNPAIARRAVADLDFTVLDL